MELERQKRRSKPMPESHPNAEAVAQSPFDTEHLKSDIKSRSLRGGAATILGQGARFCIQMVSTVVLARLLVPADFGMVAMVTAITRFAGIFGDIGLSMATIQKPEINHEQVSTLFWVNVGLSMLTATAVAVSAPAIALFYDEPRLTMITIALAGTFFLGGLGVQHDALLRRQMRFTALESIRFASMVTGVGAAIIFALLGAGYWALVVMQVVSTLVAVIGVWVASGWYPGRPVRRSGVKGMLAFGSNVTGFNVVNYFARSADNILIGRFWGSGPLGFYGKAYNLLMMPLKQINMPLASVVVPALSRLHGDHQKYRRYYLRTISLITLLSTPIVAWLIVCSEDLILVMLGSQWLPASRIFSVLGFSALIQPLYFTQGWLHMSSGRSDRYLRWGVVASFLIVLAFLVGLPHGPIGVAAAYAVVSWAIIVPCMWYAGNSAGIRTGDIFGAVYKNIGAGLGSIVISIGLLEHVLFLEGTWANLLLGLLSISVSYNVLLFAFHRTLSPWSQIVDVVATFIRPGVKETARAG
jgi:O-antigen/teichoic acid export membrane protein